MLPNTFPHLVMDKFLPLSEVFGSIFILTAVSLAPLLGMYRKKLLPIKASGTKLNQCPQLAGVLLSVAQWWRVWKLHRWAGGGGRAGDRLGYVLVLSGSPSEQEALAHEELAELRTWSGW